MSEIENTPEVERVSEGDKKLNRQINFYIMRYMWQVIRGRSPAGKGDSIYMELDTSRERYTRIIDGENVRISDADLDKWTKRTGLSGGVFSGDIRIKYASHGETVSANTTQGWKELFALRAERENAYGLILKAKARKQPAEDSKEAHSKAKKAYADKEKEIQNRLKTAKRRDSDHEEFSKLCYWLTHLEAAPAKIQDEDVRVVIKALNSLTFRKLDDCELNLLKGLILTLQNTQKLAKPIYDYKSKVKEEEEKRKKREE